MRIRDAKENKLIFVSCKVNKNKLLILIIKLIIKLSSIIYTSLIYYNNITVMI